MTRDKCFTSVYYNDIYPTLTLSRDWQGVNLHKYFLVQIVLLTIVDSIYFSDSIMFKEWLKIVFDGLLFSIPYKVKICHALYGHL